MKNVLIAAIAGITIMGTVGIATSSAADGYGPTTMEHDIAPAYSDGFTYFGKLEYAPENDATYADLGVKYLLADNFLAVAKVIGEGEGDFGSLSDTSYELGAEYHTSAFTKAYIKHTIFEDDGTGDYTTVGVSFEY